MIKHLLEVERTARGKSLVVHTMDDTYLLYGEFGITYQFLSSVPVEMGKDYQTLRRNISRAKEEGLMKVRAYQSNKIK